MKEEKYVVSRVEENIKCPRCSNGIRTAYDWHFGDYQPSAYNSDYSINSDCFICSNCGFRVSGVSQWIRIKDMKIDEMCFNL